MIVAAMLVFMVAAFFCRQDSAPSFLPSGNLFKFGYNTVVALLGIIAFMPLFARSADKKILLLFRLGGITLAVYAIHRSLGMFLLNSLLKEINIDFSSVNIVLYYLLVIIACVLLILFSLALNYLLEKTKFTRVAFLGKI